MIDWQKEFNSAITVCDTNGIIVYANDKSQKTFEKDSTGSLVGQNLFECHPDKANEIINDMMANQKTNVYTIEKKGVKKLIFQAPWYENGQFKGLVEISHVIPFEIPHFIRS